MRIEVVALFFAAGTTALSQSAAPGPMSPEKPGPIQPGIILFQKEFTKPPDSQITFGGPLGLVIPGNPGGLGRENALKDPRIIVHPPPSSIGDQPPGTAVAQNLYPGLQFLPIEQTKAKNGLVPAATWPNLKMQMIPIVWPKFEIKPAESGAAKTQVPQK